MRKLDFNFWMGVTWDIVATVEMIMTVFYMINHDWIPAVLLGLASLCGWIASALFYREWLRRF